VAASPLSLLALAGGLPVGEQLAASGLRGQQLRGLLIVGPEGDLTPGEYDALLSAGAKPVGLGPYRLRTETAAIALLSLAALGGG